MPEDRRDQLEAYIANSKSTRRVALWFAAIGAALAVLAKAAGASTGVFLAIAMVAALVGGVGSWITFGHIEEFEKELRSLRRSSR
jgi:hypothetical protein